MSKVTTGHGAQIAARAGHEAAAKGIAAGTIVLTMDGALPVDFLSPGDRIITRAGMRVLRAVHLHRYSGAAIRIRSGALGHDRPEQDLTLPADTLVHLRDWRAGALFGAEQAQVPLHRLVDGEFVAPEEVKSMRLYDLRFDAPQVIYAEGLELPCAAAEATIRLAAE